MARPESVTVVCWVIIAMAIEAVIGMLSGIVEAPLKDMVAKVGGPMNFSQTIVSGTLTCAANIVFALFMLRGADWARIAYFCLLGIMLLGMLANHSRIPTVILMTTSTKALVFGFFLFRPEAREFFRPPRQVAMVSVPLNPLPPPDPPEL